MSIDRTPAVGRYLMREDIFRSGFVRLAGVITKISKSRIYYQEAAGRESFTTGIAAVCDTREEVNSLIEFNRQCREEFQEVRSRQRAKFASFFAATKEPA